MQVAGTQTLCPCSVAFLRLLTGSWMGCGETGTQSNIHLGYWCTGDNFLHRATTAAPIVIFLIFFYSLQRNLDLPSPIPFQNVKHKQTLSRKDSVFLFSGLRSRRDACFPCLLLEETFVLLKSKPFFEMNEKKENHEEKKRNVSESIIFPQIHFVVIAVFWIAYYCDEKKRTFSLVISNKM